MDYSNSMAISGFEPLVGEEYAAWLEIRPRVGEVELLHSDCARIVMPLGDEKNSVLVEQKIGDETNVSKHSNAESAGYFIGGIVSHEYGINWDDKLQQEFVSTLSHKQQALILQLRKNNPDIRIKDDYSGDLPTNVFRSRNPFIHIVVANSNKNDHIYSMIRVTDTNIELNQYEGTSHKILWTSEYSKYLSYRDEVIKQLVASTSSNREKKLETGDIHNLAGRIFAAKTHYNPKYSIPRTEYTWII